jgi:hypothetical protein
MSTVAAPALMSSDSSGTSTMISWPVEVVSLPVFWAVVPSAGLPVFGSTATHSPRASS